MTGRTKARSFYLAVEGTYGVDPNADGSGYTPIPVEGLGYPVDGRVQLETSTDTGTLHNTAPEVGPDGATIDFQIPLIGLLSRAGDGIAGSSVTDDWMDMIYAHIFGSQISLTGDGVDVGSTASNLITDGDETYTVDDLLPIYRGGVVPNRCQWELVDVVNSATDYDVAPDFELAPQSPAIVYGCKLWRFTRGGGATLAGVMVDDNIGTYELLGGRITNFDIGADAGGRLMASVSMRFDTKTENATGKTALPASIAAPATTTLRSVVSPFWFQGVKYGSSKIGIQLGIESAPVTDIDGAEGRSGDEVIRLVPQFTITPLRTDDLINLKRTVGRGPVLVQLGAGADAVTGLGGQAIAVDQAYIASVPDEDDQGHARLGVTLMSVVPRAGRHHVQVGRF